MFKRQMEKMQYWRAKWTYSNRYQELLRWYSLFDADGKESACSAGDLGMIPGSGRSPGEGNGYPLQYSCLENSMERGAWWATVQGVTKSQTRLTYRYTDMRDTHTHTVCKQCAYTDTRTHNKTNREHLGRAHKQGQKFCLNILHPFETISIMNVDTYVQIWKGYQTHMCILETMHTEEEEERESSRGGREEESVRRSRREKGLGMERGLFSKYIKYPKRYQKKKK